MKYKRDDTNGTVRWYIYDGLGSVLAEVDPSGNVTAGRKYDVYGLVRSGQAGISKHKFVGKLGHVSEDETGLIYMRARYMDPVLGKFVSEDPARDGINWYEYCGSNPVNLIDDSGKNPTPSQFFWNMIMVLLGSDLALIGILGISTLEIGTSAVLLLSSGLSQIPGCMMLALGLELFAASNAIALANIGLGILVAAVITVGVATMLALYDDTFSINEMIG